MNRRRSDPNSEFRAYFDYLYEAAEKAIQDTDQPHGIIHQSGAYYADVATRDDHIREFGEPVPRHILKDFGDYLHLNHYATQHEYWKSEHRASQKQARNQRAREARQQRKTQK